MRHVFTGLRWFVAVLLIVGSAGASASAVEIIVDNDSAGFRVLRGEWRPGTVGRPVGSDYLFVATVPGEPTAEAIWEATLPADGEYEVQATFIPDNRRVRDARYVIEAADAAHTVSIDQREEGRQFATLGTFRFTADQPARVRLLNDSPTRGLIVADAVIFRTPGEPATATAPEDAPAEPAADSGAAEFRGMWVTRFEWPKETREASQAHIEHIMATLAEHRFNAVFFQVRGQADVFYPSAFEPWSPLIAPDGQDPGWDPLEFAIDAAHRHGLEFHAYVNTHTCWHDGKERLPADPSHLLYLHCDARNPEARDWLVHDERGQPVQFASDGYVWMAPGVPAMQAYVRQQVMHLVNRYDVDGVHFDRIRTPAPQFSHDPVSVARQQPGSPGNPDNLDMPDWTREQFTRMLADLYAQIAEVKPHLKVSSSPLGLYRQERYPNYPPYFQYAYSKTHQDAQTWLAAGVMDFIVPQIYWPDDEKPPQFSEVLPDWLAHAAGRQIVAGINRNASRAEMVQMVRAARELGAAGVTVFHFGGFEKQGYFKLFSGPRGVFAKPAAVPRLPWKDRPTDAIILGTVSNTRGEPIVDAQIRREGSVHTALSSADGLFALLKVPPGTHTVTVRGPAGESHRTVEVQADAGGVVRVDVRLDEPATTATAVADVPATLPAVVEIAAEPASPPTEPELTREPTDTAPAAMAEIPSQPAALPPMQTQPAPLPAESEDQGEAGPSSRAPSDEQQPSRWTSPGVLAFLAFLVVPVIAIVAWSILRVTSPKWPRRRT